MIGNHHTSTEDIRARAKLMARISSWMLGIGVVLALFLVVFIPFGFLFALGVFLPAGALAAIFGTIGAVYDVRANMMDIQSGLVSKSSIRKRQLSIFATTALLILLVGIVAYTAWVILV